MNIHCRRQDNKADPGMRGLAAFGSPKGRLLPAAFRNRPEAASVIGRLARPPRRTYNRNDARSSSIRLARGKWTRWPVPGFAMATRRVNARFRPHLASQTSLLPGAKGSPPLRASQATGAAETQGVARRLLRGAEPGGAHCRELQGPHAGLAPGGC
jgi:hypothetical protein